MQLEAGVEAATERKRKGEGEDGQSYERDMSAASR